ncbi:hypothetical protein AFR_17025 [Actinoplanes friuliensis DSM 7358]|uniref:Recombinase domain-containing protein n=1 Tax=Actinoplanes friuliensis DSM 7358 TaxID=1246995 RepID=U5VXI6_9ACTN|nr:hypothetical protein AFR_17025 [Actinoplanes friuliensis DSM 7358]
MSRPRACSDDTLLLVVQLVRAGWSQRAISEVLNGLDIPTPNDCSHWYASYVCRLLQTRDGRRLLAVIS